MPSNSEELWERLRLAAGCPPNSGRDIKPDPYILNEDLAAAAEIAIRLKQPLLLTGDPGTGKTGFAVALAHHLSMPLERCHIRSTTTVADLFYGIDELARFRDAQPGAAGLLPLQYYMTFSGLGRAVLFAGGPDAAASPVRSRLLRPTTGDLGSSAPPTLFSGLYPPERFPDTKGARVVVLLDEFDKAPRDTPNDMLNEIQEMAFEIAELGIRLEAPTAKRPIIVVTSNSESSLPDPFLRRCIYYDIKFPKDAELLRLIVFQHLPLFDGGNSPLLDSALSLFAKLHRESLRRRPGTAELLDWLTALTTSPAQLKPTDALDTIWTTSASVIRRSLPALVKARDDYNTVERLLTAEFGTPSAPLVV